MAIDKIEPHHFGALDRARYSFQKHMDEITKDDPQNYDAIFPEGDKKAIDEIIEFLRNLKS